MKARRVAARPPEPTRIGVGQRVYVASRVAARAHGLLGRKERFGTVAAIRSASGRSLDGCSADSQLDFACVSMDGLQRIVEFAPDDLDFEAHFLGEGP